MRIITINQFIGEEKYCPPYRTNYLAAEWVKSGHDVTIISASYSHLFHRFPSFKGLQYEVFNNGIRYIYFKTPKYKGNGIARVVNLFVFIFLLTINAKKLSNTLRPDVIISASVYPVEIWPIIYIAKFNGSKIIREVRDLWPLTLIELANFSKYHPFVLLLSWAERFSFKKTDKLITTLSHSEEYMKEHSLDSSKWYYIPQGVEMKNSSMDNVELPQNISSLFDKLKSENQFIVGYTGGHGLANSLETLVMAAALVTNENITFILIGQGEEKERLIKRVKELKLTNVYFLSPIEKKYIPTFLSNIDVAYIGWKKNPIYRFGLSPNKLMDYMLSGKPVVSNEAPADLVVLSNCGFSIPSEDPNALVLALKKLMSLTDKERNAMGIRGREYVLKNHDYRLLAPKYLDVIIT